MIDLSNITKRLDELGYSIEEGSVEGKNQTRYIHMILHKNSEKYFAKANIKRSNYLDLANEKLSKHLPDDESFSILKPVEELNIGEDQVLIIYPYIKVPSISTESKDFTDFSVNQKDLSKFFDSLYSALLNLESSKIYTYKDIALVNPLNSDNILSWLEKIDSESSTIVEALQILSTNRGVGFDFVISMADTHPQNMFWDSNDKHLYLFDMESIQHKPKFFDFAKFSSAAFIVCKQFDVSKDWLKYLLEKITITEDIGLLHLMLLYTGVEFYVYFKRISDFDRTKHSVEFVDWVLRDFVELVNNETD